MLALTISDQSGKKKRFPLFRSGMTVGRASGNDIVLNDVSVSNYHAEFFLDDVSTKIRDGVDGKPSSNGLFLNKQRIHQLTPLKAGDSVAMGVYQFSVEDEVLDLQAEENTFEIENLVQFKAALLFERKTPKVVEKIVRGAVVMGLSDGKIISSFESVVKKLQSEGKTKQVQEIQDLKEKVLGAPRTEKEGKKGKGESEDPMGRYPMGESPTSIRTSPEVGNRVPGRDPLPTWFFISGLVILILIGLLIILWKS